MNQNEKLAVQTVLIEELNRRAEENPTLLVDALLSGQGDALVHNLLSREAAAAKGRAATLDHLLKAYAQDASMAKLPEKEVA